MEQNNRPPINYSFICLLSSEVFVQAWSFFSFFSTNWIWEILFSPPICYLHHQCALNCFSENGLPTISWFHFVMGSMKKQKQQKCYFIVYFVNKIIFLLYNFLYPSYTIKTCFYFVKFLLKNIINYKYKLSFLTVIELSVMQIYDNTSYPF